VGENKIDLDLGSLASGTYMITIWDQEFQRRDLILTKQ
jgi:hypothetical protein